MVISNISHTLGQNFRRPYRTVLVMSKTSSFKHMLGYPCMCFRSYLAAMFIPKTPATRYWTLHRWTCHRLLDATSLDVPQAIGRYIVGRATGYWPYLAAMFIPKTPATGYWTLYRWTCHRLLALPRCHVHSQDASTCHRLLDTTSSDVPQAIGLTSLPCSPPRRKRVRHARKGLRWRWARGRRRPCRVVSCPGSS